MHSTLTSDYSDLMGCKVFVVCVLTGVDKHNNPDLSPLINACESLGKIIKNGDLVVFESTVYPGAVEEIYVPLLEKYSNLKLNDDFYVGYSPERINVGDREHRLAIIPKVIAGSNDSALSIMQSIYSTIIDAPVIKASSIKVAEAAKMYENVQRDVLIALANEYAGFCKREGISIEEVTECAASKWNFMKVFPGLVGGHCIGIDPYYLLQRAKEKNHPLAMVQTARIINETEPKVVAHCIKEYTRSIDAKSILLLGFSYKANTPDCRNTKVAEVFRELEKDVEKLACFDPLVNPKEVLNEYGIRVVQNKEDLKADYDMVVTLVPHRIFNDLDFPNSKNIYLKDLL